MDKNTIDLQTLVEAAAKDACENNFSSRRGIYFITYRDSDSEYADPAGAICIYNNNPYKDPAQREGEIAAFRQWLAANGYRELSAAYYPTKDSGDPQPGYTFAMLIAGDEEQVDEVSEAYERITIASAKTMCEPGLN
jgi:hypothetical protein